MSNSFDKSGLRLAVIFLICASLGSVLKFDAYVPSSSNSHANMSFSIVFPLNPSAHTLPIPTLVRSVMIRRIVMSLCFMYHKLVYVAFDASFGVLLFNLFVSEPYFTTFKARSTYYYIFPL